MSKIKIIDKSSSSSSEDDFYDNFEKYKKLKMEIAAKNEKTKKGLRLYLKI